MPIVLQSQLPLTASFEATYLEANGFIPLALDGKTLRVAVAGDPPLEVLDDLEVSYGASLELIPVSREELTQAIRRAYAAVESLVELVKNLDAEVEGRAGVEEHGTEDARDVANQAPVKAFVSGLLRDAHAARASDIHLESTPDGLLVRLRVDGMLADTTAPPKAAHTAVLNRVKLMAGLDIAERRVAQDGRVRVRLEERELDLRVSAMPALHGESVVVRLLDRGGRPVRLDELGMPPALLDQFRAIARRPHGLVLATGPTGSGKTTTLYAALALRNVATEKVLTIEDPVEYHLDRVIQIPVHRKAGMTFAGALRSILRQDPDVVMVGEMRDRETADAAVHGAMTGHLVFSTLHTNDALSALARLADLGVPRYEAGAAVEAVLAQRLVRKICEQCRERYVPDPQAVARVARGPVGETELERGHGCSACRQTGYYGRTGIFELFVVTDIIKSALSRDTSLEDVGAMARENGMRTMQDDGWAKVQQGITTVEEVLRVTEH